MSRVSPVAPPWSDEDAAGINSWGHPDRTYGWILSRTPELTEETFEGIMQRLEAKGYDVSLFKMTKHKKH